MIRPHYYEARLRTKCGAEHRPFVVPWPPRERYELPIYEQAMPITFVYDAPEMVEFSVRTFKRVRTWEEHNRVVALYVEDGTLARTVEHDEAWWSDRIKQLNDQLEIEQSKSAKLEDEVAFLRNWIHRGLP